MSKADYTRLAEDVVKAVGGKTNIISVTNCMTRLRFVLKDDTIPDKEKVKAVNGVKGVMNQGGQYQVVIGTHVNEVVKDVRRAAGISDEDAAHVPKDTSLWNRFFKIISGCIMPMLGPMIAGGIIKGVLTILTTVGVLSNTDGTYLILYAASDAGLYFMPILVGFTCGKMFGCSPYVTAVIGASFLYPDLLAAVAAEGGISFLNIPVTAATYFNTFLPVLLASFFASKLEKLAKKFIPAMIQMMLVPAFILVITVPAGWLVIGPVMNMLSGILSSGVTGIFGFSPLLGGIVIGGFWQLMVVLGLHYAFIPVLMSSFFTKGYDPVNAVMGLTVWALAGLALGYGLKVKDAEQKSLGFGNMASALCGVTEPTIYSIALPNIKLFACAWIGGGIAGGILGQLGGNMYALSGDGLFRIPGMINPEGLDISFYGFIFCALLAFGVTAVLTYILTPTGIQETAAGADSPVETAQTQGIFADGLCTVSAPVKGNEVAQSDISDETFASGVLGKGIGIEPAEGLVVAPFDGEVSSVVDTKHAVGISSVDGIELLIHVGMDTVKMNGEGFQLLVHEGDQIKAGQKLIEFDISKIKSAGYSPVTAVIVVNSDDYKDLQMELGTCDYGKTVIKLKK